MTQDPSASAVGARPTQVILSIDTEFWPRREYLDAGDYRVDFERDMLGRTDAGDFGLAWQAEVLRDHGLTASFFVEALAANAVGLDYLKEAVAVLNAHQQDVQLHIHTEWQRWMKQPVVASFGDNMNDFHPDDQSTLIAQSLSNLRAAGAQDVVAYRAGNYGANVSTLDALIENGLTIDTSYNPAYLHRECQMESLSPNGDLLQPIDHNGLIELPINFVRDALGKKRHLQICACSFSEMRAALDQAYANGWSTLILVSHSHEFIRGRGTGQKPQPDRTVIARFLTLCRYLAANSDRFITGPISLQKDVVGQAKPTLNELSAPLTATAKRFAEQAWRRLRS